MKGTQTVPIKDDDKLREMAALVTVHATCCSAVSKIHNLNKFVPGFKETAQNTVFAPWALLSMAAS